MRTLAMPSSPGLKLPFTFASRKTIPRMIGFSLLRLKFSVDTPLKLLLNPTLSTILHHNYPNVMSHRKTFDNVNYNDRVSVSYQLKPYPKSWLLERQDRP